MVYGYSRVSTAEQTLDLQLDALNSAKCDRIFMDKMSGGRDDRPGLQEMMAILKRGDVVTVWKLDRLSRSVSHLLKIVAELTDLGVELKSVTESLDTRTPTGKFTLVILSAFSEMEKSTLQARTKAGLEAARLRGRIGGRPRAITDEQIETARRLMQDESRSIASICRSLQINKSSFYRLVKNKV